MGYTHYWETNDGMDLGEYREAIVLAAQIVRKSPVPLGNGNGEGVEPELTDSWLCFNGRGDDDRHEGFILRFTLRERHDWEDPNGPLLAFCKTARKPYDVVVTAVLAVMDRLEGFNVSSDGNPDEWAPGVALARAVLDDDSIQVPELVVNP